MQHPIHRRTLRPRATFRDAALQEEFATRGYVVVPLLSAEHIRMLTDLYHSLPSGIESGFYSVMFSPDPGYRDRVSEGIQAVMLALTAPLLADYRALAGSYMVKLPGSDSALAAHQDWNMVDEAHYVSINVWAPLTPLTAENGALSVMPGSHLFIDGLRASVLYPSCLDPHQEVVRDRYLQQVTVPEGHAVIHNSALVHASKANQSPSPRVVASLSMIPSEARPVHYYLDPATGDVDYFEVDTAFFLRHLIGQRPTYPVTDRIQGYQAPPLTGEELERLFTEHNGARI